MVVHPFGLVIQPFSSTPSGPRSAAKILYPGADFRLLVDPVDESDPGRRFLAGGATVQHVDDTEAFFGGLSVDRRVAEGGYCRDIETVQKVLQLRMRFGIGLDPIGDYADRTRCVAKNPVGE